MLVKRILIAALAVAAVLVSFEIGRVANAPASFVSPLVSKISQKTAVQPSNIDLSQFWEVWNEVHSVFYDRAKLNDQTLVYGAIKGMVRASGDKYGEFFTPEEAKNFLDSIEGSFDGIGAQIGVKNDQIIVVAPLKGTPAERAGLKPKDAILKIDDASTAEMSLEQAVSLIKGPRGSKVRLSIGREGVDAAFDVTITRAHIEIPIAEGKVLEPGVGYVSLSTFTDTAPEKFRTIAKDLKSQGVRRLIIDVRNNPGGVLTAAVEIASVFTGPGQVIAIEKLPEGKPVEHKTLGAALFADAPLVLLVNGGSASASEILAGALRDLKGAKLVGEQTFGKGSVQSFSEVSKKASLKLTTAHWFTPKEYSIEGQGLAPDVVVKAETPDKTQKDQPDSQLNAALDVLKKL